MQSSGVVSVVDALPSEFYDLLLNALQMDRLACRGLDKIGIHSEEERVLKYFDCNYSAYDGHSDVTTSGALGPREFVTCANRGGCKAEGLLCQFPGRLTKRQFEVAHRIALGQMDAQICIELSIAQDTLRNHKKTIELKTSSAGKVAIGVWAAMNKVLAK